MNEYFEKIINEYGFEKREGQEKMAQLIQNCIDENKSCLVEAGTGIGKTLAYLLPAILYSKKNEKRVVISTNTINLQEQIIDKDLPLLEKIIGEKINYRLVKGRGNYVCGNRLINNCTDPSIIDWYKKTKTGDKSEIDFYIDPSVWEQIKSDKDYCINAKCSQTDNCFYYKIKEKIKDCEILIVNHALLLSHFKYDKVLPDFDFLVIDESHNLENIARTYFEDSLSAKDLGLNFGLIYNKRTNKGIFTKLALQIEGIEKIYVDYIDTFNRLYDAFFDLFTKISLELTRISATCLKLNKVYDKKTLKKSIDKIIETYEIFEEINKKLLEYPMDEETKQEYLNYYSKIKEGYKIIQEFLEKELKNSVRWFRINQANSDIEICITPLDISEKLKIIYQDRIVIMTSATLKIANSFSYINERLGLANFEKYTVESPFDYDKNMKILLSKNKFEPNSLEYLNYSIEFLNKYLNEKKEGTFILCTSYKQVELISKGLKLKDCNVLVQGQMSRKKMIEEFKNSKNAAVLIGTDSFWEGVDVKGNKLKNIVILKLPFFVPNNPVNEALIEEIKKKGINPFINFQLPQAIIKLKQGVGRLIRSKSDSGEVIILDNRIKSKSYGALVLASLPSKTIELMI